jgi:radical SAM protein with 4Fe4S-binding SPASM domain
VSDLCPNPTDGFGFSQEEIAAAVRRHGLLSMEIEFSLACNFRCPYCYNDRTDEARPLSSQEIDDVLRQAKELGARKIIILGGEPMIYPGIREKIAFIRAQGQSVEMFTNGTGMTPENARFMFDHEVAVVVKMNTFKPELQGRMAGHEAAPRIIRAALENLQAAGYPAPGKRMAVSTVICRQNIEELPELWRWLRRRGIEPYFEMVTPRGRAKDGEWVSPETTGRLFDEIARIDREEFGRDWKPQPPLVGNTCLRHRFSCLVSANGTVMPCVGVTIPLGNIRATALREILSTSEVVENLRDFPARIKSPCKECEKAGRCYGCRGAAYQLTGDYLAADPQCWLHRNAHIQYLPAGAAPYLPHQPPVLMIDALVSVGERCAELRAQVSAGNLFLDEQGVLNEEAYIEILAQAAAALHGFHQTPEERARHRGMMTGARNFVISGEARAGDTLEIRLKKIAKLDHFGVVEGVIRRGGKEIARGEVNIWQAAGAPA